MASIFKRKLKDGKGFKWRAVIRITGYPITCETFDRKQEAEDWAQKTEQSIKQGQYQFDKKKGRYTYQDLLHRLESDGVLSHYRSLKNTISQFNHWKKRLGSYALVHLTTELMSKERQHLIDTPGPRGLKRSPATVNRYMAVLSSTLSYAVKQLRWINENPCSNLLKLKVNSGRDRVLSDEELKRLLDACRQSRSPFLYCIVLIAITTGARRGEILGLEWRHVDFENKLAHLKETKNGRPRSVALTDEVIEELKKLQVIHQVDKPLVFASKTAFGRIDIKKAWQEALQRASISGYRLHDVRHQFCTLAAGFGASNLELSTCMGHRTLGMLQRYTHLDVQVTQKFSKKISDKLLESRDPGPMPEGGCHEV